MKRQFLTGILLMLLGVFFPLLLQAAPVGKITALEGRVDVTVSGEAARPVNQGDAVNVGDILRTKSKSKCEVTFIDGNVLRLADNTRVRVTEYLVTPGKRLETVDLFRGKIRAVVNTAGDKFGPGTPNRFEVHTPTAVCGVRGSDLNSSFINGMSLFTLIKGLAYSFAKGRPGNLVNFTGGKSSLVFNINQRPVVQNATQQQQGTEDTDPSGGGATTGETTVATTAETTVAPTGTGGGDTTTETTVGTTAGTTVATTVAPGGGTGEGTGSWTGTGGGDQTPTTVFLPPTTMLPVTTVLPITTILPTTTVLPTTTTTTTTTVETTTTTVETTIPTTAPTTVPTTVLTTVSTTVLPTTTTTTAETTVPITAPTTVGPMDYSGFGSGNLPSAGGDLTATLHGSGDLPGSQITGAGGGFTHVLSVKGIGPPVGPFQSPVSGVWVDLVNLLSDNMGVSGGILAGNRAAGGAWTAELTGTWMPLDRYHLLLLSNKSALAALNIPYVQMGTDILTYNKPLKPVNGINLLEVPIAFYGYSTGGVRLWTSPLIAGGYIGTPSAGGAPVPLAGKHLTAQFRITAWEAQKLLSGRWAAELHSGGGSLNGQSINFRGWARGGFVGTTRVGVFTGKGVGPAE